MNPSPGVIRTPDQRLRVFVSSTLKELAPERRVTRAAVERLHLAPVMFELGARPHPPRELYRAYLQQSDVFVGIYGDSYGWVAPDESVSGLEDEYNLAGSLPKLIYIRESVAGREERLDTLLSRVRDDDGASFKYFTSPQELRKLIEADLATLLAERFDQSRAAPAPAPAAVAVTARASAIPAPLTGLIGRGREVSTVEDLLKRDAVRLVTLIGPGGIGKSRVAMAVAGRQRARGGREVVFVDLTPVQDAALVPNAIAQSLGVLDTGDEAVLDKLKTALRDREALIVVDNFEQVLSAATTLTALLAEAPALKFLVTSRTLLRVSGEYAVEVGPLELPDGSPGADDEVPASVVLFVERARAVKPDFELNADNAAAIAAICVALDGVPLALELAAARIRMLTPESMLSRLDRRLSLLAGGARDLPARQQTLRSTIEWSTQLLGREERLLLEKLGVFSGGFSLDAVEAVAGDDCADPIYSLGVLVDNSLVRERDQGGQPYFSMLATVREYALEQLGESGALAATRAAHAEYFSTFAKSLETDLEDEGLRHAITVLNTDRDNLRATARHYLDAGELDAVAEFTWTLLIYWWVAGLLGEVRGWMDEVLAASGVELQDRTRAIALYFTRSITLWHDSTESVIPGLTESAELFHRVQDRQAEGMALIFLGLAGLADKPPDPERAQESLDESIRVLRSVGDDWGEAMALVTLGRVSLMKRALHEAIDHFEASLSLARRRRDDLGTAIALHHLGWATMVQGDRARARELFEESLATAARLGHAEGVAYGLEGLTAIAAADQDVSRAGRLLRASESLRNQTGLHTATRFSFHEHYLAPILAGEHAEELERVRTEGNDLSIEDAVKFALEAGA